MQALARNRFLKVSPRKMRRVAKLVKGKPVEEALDILNFSPQFAAHHLAKTVKSAAANAIANVGTARLKPEDLTVTRILVDGAPTAKRVRFQSMGRVFRIRKRYCHLTVEVEGEAEEEASKKDLRKRRKVKEKVASEKKSGVAKKGKKAASSRATDEEEKTADMEKETDLSEAQAEEKDAGIDKAAESSVPEDNAESGGVVDEDKEELSGDEGERERE